MKKIILEITSCRECPHFFNKSNTALYPLYECWKGCFEIESDVDINDEIDRRCPLDDEVV